MVATQDGLCDTHRYLEHGNTSLPTSRHTRTAQYVRSARSGEYVTVINTDSQSRKPGRVRYVYSTKRRIERTAGGFLAFRTLAVKNMGGSLTGTVLSAGTV